MGSSAATTATFCATLVDEWIACGVRHAVVSPGSRSTPIALEIAERDELAIHIFHDERSAAFAALGIARASGVPPLLVCSSGTAAVEFHPAIVEAHQSELPIIVCTADRPDELQGVGAPQTIDQINLYGVSVRKFVNAQVAQDSQRNLWRGLALDLFATSLGKVSGPVHLNLRFREPLIGVAGELPMRDEKSALISQDLSQPSTRIMKRLHKLLSNKKGLIVAGPEKYRNDSIVKLAEALGWPIIADPRSSARVPNRVVVAAADSILRDADSAKQLKPEVVLRFGALPASKVVNSWLTSSGVDQVVVTTTPTLIDPDRMCSLHIVADIDEICLQILESKSIASPTDWLASWSLAEQSAQKAINLALADEKALTEPGVARALVASLPDDSHFVVSSSMPIRDVEWFGAPRHGLRVHANRGANGIDGVVSTSVGVAIATGKQTTLLIGDIAFLHDSNGLLNLGQRDVDLRIIVIDNNGGGIFSFLPQAEKVDETKFEKLFGTPHQVDIALLTKAHQIAFHEIENLEELGEVLALRGPWVARVATDRKENVKVHERINQSVAASLR